MKSNRGLTLIESLVCLVIIGIGFIAVNQLITFAIVSMDRSLERTKVNFLSDSNNSSNYTFNENCKHTSQSSLDLSGAQKNKWRNKFSAANQIKLDGKDKKPRCLTGDEKRAYVTATTARFIYATGKGKNKKYLGVGLK